MDVRKRPSESKEMKLKKLTASPSPLTTDDNNDSFEAGGLAVFCLVDVFLYSGSFSEKNKHACVRFRI